MPRSSSEKFYDAIVELRALITKHSKEHETAVQYYNKLLTKIDNSSSYSSYDWEKEESSLPMLLKTIHALKQDVFSGSGLPCFAKEETSQATLLQQHGHFGKADCALVDTKEPVVNEAATNQAL